MQDDEKAEGKKFNIYAAFPAYGGNGGIAMELPVIREWWAKSVIDLKANESVGRIMTRTYSDTPITMVRNKMVLDARKAGADFLLMVDSDNVPDMYYGIDREAEQFLPTALEFLIRHYPKGPAVVGAPYCGPPPHPVTGGEENVYVFHLQTAESDALYPSFKLDQYSRNHAAMMRGIQACAALPTGLILFDIRAFDVTEPKETDRERWKGWFYYEWEDRYAAGKASTEDVTATRDMAFAGVPLFCQWNSWAGHMKPKCVGRPRMMYADEVSSRMREALAHGIESDMRQVEVNPGELEPLEDVGELLEVV